VSSHQFSVDRPGHQSPWLAIVTYNWIREEWDWGLYTHVRVTEPRWNGHAATRQAAIDAAEFAAQVEAEREANE
jgi:hypothetical protein